MNVQRGVVTRPLRGAALDCRKKEAASAHVCAGERLPCVFSGLARGARTAGADAACFTFQG